MDYLIFGLVILGVGITSYNLGIKEGASKTVEKLIDLQIIKLDGKANLISGK